MPMNRSLYPAYWPQLAQLIKRRADWTCQDCGRPCYRPGETFPDLANRLPREWTWQLDRPRRFILTVAHLNHRPEDCAISNLKALCTVCHCRMDLAAMATKRAIARERQGQLTLPL
jgi:hypothetical protein